jgi:tRNA-2-methylthio-N6-dimethylallyladenosine synthase
MEAIATHVPTVKRLRYITSHPKDMSEDLIRAHGDLECLMPYLHLPVQSGSDAVLERMNRQHTAESYLEILERLKQVRPDIALSSDFIVGFPGESDADFEATLKIVQQVGYAQAYSFKYSIRPGTPAGLYEDQIPEEVKDARLARLQAVILDGQRAFNEKCVGLTLPVLFERAGKVPGQIVGKSPYLQSVHIQGESSLLGRIVDVKILSGYANSLEGAMV